MKFDKLTDQIPYTCSLSLTKLIIIIIIIENIYIAHNKLNISLCALQS